MIAVLTFIAGAIIGALIAVYLGARWIVKNLPSPAEMAEIQKWIESKVEEEERASVLLLTRAKLI